MDCSRLSMPLGEAIFTQRSIRRFRPDPVPLTDVRLMLEAAVRAPNGSNQQIARFLVVNDRATIREFATLYHEAWWAKRRDEGFQQREDLPPPLSCLSRTGRRYGGGTLHRVRVGTGQRASQLCHSRRSKPDARGAGHRDRFGADDASPIRNGSLPRHVQYPRRCKLPFLCAARLSAGQFRAELSQADLGDDLSRPVGRSRTMGMTGVESITRSVRIILIATL